MEVKAVFIIDISTREDPIEAIESNIESISQTVRAYEIMQRYTRGKTIARYGGGERLNMYARAEVAEQYKQAVREYLEQRSEFNRGRFSGLATALCWFEGSIGEIDEMFHTCQEEVKDERAQEDAGPMDVGCDKEELINKKQTIEIEVKGGAVVDVRNVPEGWCYNVIDSDIMEED